MVNPCFCGCSLKTATLILAVLEMVFAVMLGIIIAVTFGISIGAGAGDTAASPAFLGIMISVLIVLLLVFMGKFYLGWTLKVGAEQDDYRKCRIWLIVTAVLFVLSLIIIFSCQVTSSCWEAFLGTFAASVYEIFSMWVVYEFMQQIKSGPPHTNYNLPNNIPHSRIEKV